MVDRDKQELTRIQKIRRKFYPIARAYWKAVGDEERLALTDEELDEQFWVIDHEGIPRLKSDQDKVTLPEHPLAGITGIFEGDPDLSSHAIKKHKQAKPRTEPYTPEEEAIREQKLRRKIYKIAREYWAKVGDQERLALTDEYLDEHFWLIDHEGIPRLKTEMDQVELPEDPLEDLIGILDTDITDLSQSTRNIYD